MTGPPNTPEPEGRSCWQCNPALGLENRPLSPSPRKTLAQLSYPADFLADVFKTCRAHGVKRNEVTDYVWCLEERVNATVHSDHFPRGPSAPGFVSRNATNPSDYDADKIRATWLQNVG